MQGAKSIMKKGFFFFLGGWGVGLVSVISYIKLGAKGKEKTPKLTQFMSSLNK